MQPTRTHGSVRPEHHGGAACRRSVRSSDGRTPMAPAPRGQGCDAGGGGCRVGPGRGARLSTSPFSRTALRTRRASHPGTGLSTGPVTTNGCVAARLRSTRPARRGRTPVFTDGSCPADTPRRLAVPLRHVHAACVLGLLRALRPTRHQQPTTCLPAAPRREGGHGSLPTFTTTRSRGRCPALPGSLARGTPQPFPLASPTGHYLPAAESLAASAVGVHCNPAQIRQVGGRHVAYGGVNAGSSRAPSRLACRTRAVWQCRPVSALSGLLPPLRASPRSGCPQLHWPAATGRRRGPSIPPGRGSASWRT